MTREGKPKNGGYVSHRGYINSGPLVNGNGMINGNGIINGNGRRRNGEREGASRRILWWFTVFIMLVLAFGGVAVLNPPVPPVIPDGDLSEWKDTAGIMDAHVVDDATVDIMEYNIRYISKGPLNYLAGYVKFRGPFALDQGNCLYLFVSTNKTPSYIVLDGISANYMVRICTTENTTQANLMKYVGNGYSWEWSYESSAMVGINGNIVEFSVPFDERGITYMYVSASPDGVMDITPAFSENKIPVMLTQVPRVDRNELYIEVSAGGSVMLTSIMLSVEGNADIVPDVGTYDPYQNRIMLYRELSAGETFEIHLTINGTGLVKTHIVDVDTDGIPTIRGREFAKYYGTPPRIEIDGAFEDWKNIAKVQDPTGDVDNPNVDILEHAAVTRYNTTYFYIKVAGKSLEGAPIPITTAEAGPPIEIVKKDNYDFVRIYYTHGNETHYIEIRGINGKIIGTYIDGQPTTAVNAAAGIGEVEIGVYLNISANTTYRIVMTDWNGLSDSTAGTIQGGSSAYRNTGDVIPVPEFQYSLAIPAVVLLVLIVRRRDA